MFSYTSTRPGGNKGVMLVSSLLSFFSWPMNGREKEEKGKGAHARATMEKVPSEKGMCFEGFLYFYVVKAE